MVRRALGSDLATVLADDLATDAQLHASAAPAGWPDEIGLEDRSKLFSGDRATVVADFYFYSSGWFGASYHSDCGYVLIGHLDGYCIPRQEQQI